MESSLSLSYNDLIGEVGLFLGYGRGATFGEAAWTVQQQNAIDSCVKSGLRQFYFPPPAEGTSSSYDWSFLKPVATLDFPIGATTLPLPDDFGGFEGEITLLSTVSQVSWPVRLVGEGMVRQQASEMPNSTGRPMLAAIVPIKGTGPTKGQRFQLSLWPASDQDYTLQFAYYILADYLNGAFPYSYGGMAHAETLLESCLCIAEQRLDDSSTVHAMKFSERLLASISLDRRHKPQLAGYNGDRSDRRSFDRRDIHWDNLVTVYGTQY